MEIKKYIKQALVSLVPKSIKLEITKTFKPLINPQHAACSYLNLSFSQEGEDLILSRLFGDKQNGFYIDIGAHHPYRFSNTYKFYLKGWTGINIDPLPGSMKLFNIIRPNDINLEFAILDKKDEELLYYVFDEPALNTFDSEAAKQLNTNTKYKIQEAIKVEIHRLDEIIEKYLPINQQIDFISIDVEGLDFSVIKSNDWQKYRPQYIICESISKTLEDDLNGELTLFMKSNGYTLHSKTVNSLIYIKN